MSAWSEPRWPPQTEASARTSAKEAENKQTADFGTFQEGPHRVCITFTMVLLCRMKVWKPNHRSFMHSSNATITKASSSRVAWTYRGTKCPLTPSLHAGAHVSACVRACVRACVCLSTHVDVQTQRGHSGSFTKRQHHEEQTSQQLHHVEEVVVGKQVRCQCLCIPRMSEELIIVLSLLFEDT